MFVKSLGRRGSYAVAKSLLYVSKDEKALTRPDGSKVVFTHNLFGKNLSQIELEYKLNEIKRIHPRSNNIKVLHTILAYSPEDNEQIDINKLESITRKYFDLLNPNALYYATVHHNNEDANYHVHVVVSPTDLMGKSTRQSWAEFQALKINLQEYQQENYSELQASIVNHGAENEHSQLGYWHNKDEIPKKEQLRQTLTHLFDLSQNRQEFFSLLNEDGLATYERGGKIAGIDGDRHYRFTTLGIDLSELDKREARLNELVEITEEKEPVVEIVEVKEEEEQEAPIESGLSEEDERLDEEGLFER